LPASSEESKVMSISIRYGVLFINNLNKWLYNRAQPALKQSFSPTLTGFNMSLVQVKRSADLALASADTTICATVPENIMEVKRSADLALASADTTICATVPENIMEQNFSL
jgi:hypothetical protein